MPGRNTDPPIPSSAATLDFSESPPTLDTPVSGTAWDASLSGNDAGTAWENPEATAEPARPAPASTIPPTQLGIGNEIPREILGRYVPTAGTVPIRLDGGAMGDIFLFRDLALGRTVARKELKPSVLGHSQGFQREAKLTAQLEHPNIVPIYELGRTNGGLPYYTMKWVKGRTLESALASCKSLKERLKLLGHFVDVCNAVGYAHSRGVVHRDIKPQNVMVGEFGETVVLDFGIAKVVNSKEMNLGSIGGGVQETRAGALKGTPAYMAPEQARGDNENVGPHSDIWSLGVLLFRILANRLPFEEPLPEVLQRIVQDPVPSLQVLAPEAPPELVAIATKALQRDPAQRYRNARELAEDVESWQNGGTVKAYPYTVYDLFRRYATQHRSAVVMGVLLVTALSLAGILFEREQQSRRNVAEAAAQKAASALIANNVPSALEHAVEALALEERPDARGVIIATDELWESELTNRIQLRTGTGSAQAVQPKLNQVVFDRQNQLLLATEQGLLRWSPENRQVLQKGGTILALSWMADGSLRLLSQDANGLRIRSMVDDKITDLSDSLPFRPSAAVFGPDGRLYVAIPNEGLECWSADGQLIRSLPGEIPGNNPSMTISNDGTLLAWGQPDGTLTLLNLQTDLPHIPQLSGEHVAFSPDGKILATSGDRDSIDTRIHLWDLQTGQEIGALSGHEGQVMTLTFSPDSSMLMSGARDSTVRFWDIRHQRLLATRGSHSSAPTQVGFSADGTMAFSATQAGEVIEWALPKGPLPTEFNRLTRTIKSAFSRDGNRLLSSSMAGNLLLTDLKTGKTLFQQKGTGDLFLVSLNQDGQTFAWGNSRENVRIVRLDQTGEPETLPVHPSLLSLSGDGQSLAVAIRSTQPRSEGTREPTVQSMIELWDTQSHTRRWAIPTAIEQAYRLSFSNDGTLLAATTGEHLYLWNTKDGAPITPFEVSGLYVADWSNDGRIVVATNNNQLRILNPLTRESRTFGAGGHQEPLHQACFLNNDRWLVSTSRDHSVRIWDLEKGVEKVRLLIGGTEIFWLGCSADGHFSGSSTNGEVRRWSSRLVEAPIATLQQLAGVHKRDLHPDWESLQP